MSHLKIGLWFILLTITITGLLAWTEEWVAERPERKRMKEASAR